MVDIMVTKLEMLTKQVQDLQLDKAHLQEQLRLSQEQLRLAQGKEKPKPEGSDLKDVKKPKEFSGKADMARAWLGQMETYMVLTNKNPNAHVAWASTYLTESALTWWQTTAAESKNWSWKDFSERLIRRYEPIDPAYTAREKLAALTVGNRSVEAYTKEFNEIALRATDMEKGELFNRYCEMLPVDTRRQLIVSNVDDIATAQDLAIKLDMLDRQIGRDKKTRDKPAPALSTGRGDGGPRPYFPRSPAPFRPGNPLNNVGDRPQRTPAQTPYQPRQPEGGTPMFRPSFTPRTPFNPRANTIQEGCWTCGEMDHIARFCPLNG